MIAAIIDWFKWRHKIDVQDFSSPETNPKKEKVKWG